jgi:hypothetical protein
VPEHNAEALRAQLLAVAQPRPAADPEAQRTPGYVEAVIFTLIAIGALVFALSHLAGGGSLDDTQAWLLPLIFTVGFASGAIRCFRCAKRMRFPSAVDVLREDPRAPILYLRAFAEETRDRLDDLDLAPSGSRPGHDFFRQPMFEETLAKSLSKLAPVVSIGMPGDSLPPAGIHRLYVSEDQWSRAVTCLMALCAFVIIRLGSSDGVRWELEEAVARLPRKKLVIFVDAERRFPMELEYVQSVLGETFDAGAGGFFLFSDDGSIGHAANPNQLATLLAAQ